MWCTGDIPFSKNCIWIFLFCHVHFNAVVSLKMTISLKWKLSTLKLYVKQRPLLPHDLTFEPANFPLRMISFSAVCETFGRSKLVEEVVNRSKLWSRELPHPFISTFIFLYRISALIERCAREKITFRQPVLMNERTIAIYLKLSRSDWYCLRSMRPKKCVFAVRCVGDSG